MSPRELHRQLCGAVLKHIGRPNPGAMNPQRVPNQLVSDLVHAGHLRFSEDPTFHARATHLGQLLELIDRELPPVATVSNRELALRMLTVMPIVDAVIPDPYAGRHPLVRTTPRRSSW